MDNVDYCMGLAFWVMGCACAVVAMWGLVRVFCVTVKHVVIPVLTYALLYVLAVGYGLIAMDCYDAFRKVAKERWTASQRYYPTLYALPSRSVSMYGESDYVADYSSNDYENSYYPVGPRAENGDYKGLDNDYDGRTERVRVHGYRKRDGTYVRGHYRH